MLQLWCSLFAFSLLREPYNADGTPQQGNPFLSKPHHSQFQVASVRLVHLCPSESPWTLAPLLLCESKMALMLCFAPVLCYQLVFVLWWFNFKCVLFSWKLSSSAWWGRRTELQCAAHAVLDHSSVRICFTEHLLSASPSSRAGTYLVLTTVREDRHVECVCCTEEETKAEELKPIP